LRFITTSAPALSIAVFRLTIFTFASKGVSTLDCSAPRLHRAPNMEGSHGQLGSRLTNRLRRDNPDGLTNVNQNPA
jgi:hypothetical protein